MDARLPERWLNDRRLLLLTDPAFRLFVTGLMFSVANRTEGYLSDRDLKLIPGATEPHYADEIADVALWRRLDGGWKFTEWDGVQSSLEELAAVDQRRIRERDKKRRQRAALRSQSRGTSRGTSRETEPGTVQGKAKAKARQGQAPSGSEVTTQCIGCDKPARRGCQTCWAHASLEVRQ